MSNALQIDTNLTYCPSTLLVNQALRIKNVSDQQLIFKIKTNKKNYISMNPCNGYIRTNQVVNIPVKIVESVPQTVNIKLQVDWCIATQEIKDKNDIKMATVNQKDIYKKVFPIIRKQSGNKVSDQASVSQSKRSASYSIPTDSQKVQRQETKITPFETQKKEQYEQEKLRQSPVKLPEPKYEQAKQDSFIQQKEPQLKVNTILQLLSSPNKNLQVVSQQDEQDHQKQLQRIRNEQIQQRRRIDQFESKIRKISNQVKSKEIIQPKLLLLMLIVSFLTGGLLQYLIF